MSLWLTAGLATAAQCNDLKPLSVTDEIGLAHFGDLVSDSAAEVQFSPDGRYFAADVERGRLDINRPEDTLRVYDAREVEEYVRHGPERKAPAPVWEIHCATAPDGPLITHWRWLKDSSGIAYIERDSGGLARLVIANVTTRTLDAVTGVDDRVTAFDIGDREHYVYAVASKHPVEQAAAERRAGAIVGTGRSLHDLLFPADEDMGIQVRADRSDLWAVVDGRQFRVVDARTHTPIVIFDEGQRLLSLAPDGRSVVTALAVPKVPLAWEALYPPPYPDDPYRIRATQQDLQADAGSTYVSEYSMIDLPTGKVRSLTGAPTGNRAGWWSTVRPQWAKDGNSLILPNTFGTFGTYSGTRPCIAIVDLRVPRMSCIAPQSDETDQGRSSDYREITAVRFTPDARHVRVDYLRSDASRGFDAYVERSDGWRLVKQNAAARDLGSTELDVVVRQGLNEPPVLVANDRHSKLEKIIWDPNPDLQNIDLGRAIVLKWADDSGRRWRGGLYLPPTYTKDNRYPLVIQTHGFFPSLFRPSGLFPTAFAARALAGVGIVVLQIEDCPLRNTEEEAACQIRGYESAIKELTSRNIIDPSRVGIVGFSRTCFYVMAALTTSSVKFKAASITDGVMADYMQYLTSLDLDTDESTANEFDRLIGARPFGEGLSRWLNRSPLFAAERITSPLMVVGEGRASLISMWAPYAALRYMRKPVDLIMLNDSQHVLTNPAARLASQGGTVDWMRFWLQGYEDSDPAKAGQYKRWRALRELEIAEDAGRAETKAADH